MSPQQRVEANVVIVGSGVAGAIAAYKLAKLGVRDIVIVEAGPRISRGDIVRGFRDTAQLDASSGYPDPDWAPRPAWAEVNDRFARRAPYLEQIGPDTIQSEYLRVVGGSTWHWGGVTPRHLPVDFCLRSTYGVGTDWPLDYATLEPFYTDAEYEIGVAGDDQSSAGSPRSKPFPMPPVPFGYADKVIAEGLKHEGFQFVHRPLGRTTQFYDGRVQCMGFGTCSPICPSGAQYSAIYHIEKAENLGVRVLENTRADKLVADGLVKSIAATTSDGRPVTIRGNIFILAAHAVETPRLLLMSANENYPAGIANTSGMVGRHFMEHPLISCRIRMPKPVFPGRGPRNISGVMNFRDGPFRNKRPGWILTLENVAQFNHVVNDLMTSGLEPPALDLAIKDRIIREVEFMIGIEQLPHPDNRFTLNWNKKDRAGQPVVQQYYAYGDYERAGFAYARETFERMAKALNGEIVSIANPSPQHHMMGTTRMGNDPKQSVTDSFGRSHDHNNLFILGSSLFPTGGTANPTLTIAALSLRAADEIARQLGGKKKG